MFFCCVKKATEDESLCCAPPESDALSLTEYSNLLMSDRWQTRKEAVMALGKLGPTAADRAGPLLQSVLLRDDHWEVRQFAARVIGDLGFAAVADARKALQEATRDSYKHVREEAKQTLLNYGQAIDEEEEESHLQEGPMDKLGSSPPEEFALILEKGPMDKIGVDLEWRIGNSLKIMSVKEGLVQAWNKENPAQMIEEGDLIIELNGMSGDSRKLIKEILTAKKLVLRVQKGTCRNGKDAWSPPMRG
mmetsp:Transcript_54358/g.102105  ORF Transcript_54358/g.102105 Transcript_54358/m.102105 type:complete len:248 (+) Transcript_54358:98-841(+)